MPFWKSKSRHIPGHGGTVPRGNSCYDQNGAIDYFAYIYGPDHPFIVEDTWDACLNRCKEMLADSARLSKYREEAKEWFSEFLRKLEIDLGAIMSNEQRHQLESPQWVLQERGRFKPRLLMEFLVRFWLRPGVRKIQRQADKILGKTMRPSARG